MSLRSNCLIIAYCLFFHEFFLLCHAKIDPEIYQTAYEIIESKGYQADEYVIESRDGYYLTLHRIRAKNLTQDPKVALLQHGLLDSAHTWINNLANESLGFILADAGFDVFLGNSRGSTYSQRHAYLEPSDDEFWAFSWDEMAKYDLPAFIAFILKETGVKKIYYVGHSQGAQMALSRFNVDAALRDQVAAFAALAPVAYLRNIRSPVRYIAPFCKSLRTARYIFGGKGRFLPSNRLIQFLSFFLCGGEQQIAGNYARFPSSVCENFIFMLAGYNPSNTNASRLPVYLAHTPADTSIQNMVHYCQGIWTGQFEALDFGSPAANFAKYNRTTPPPYGLRKSALNLPTRVYWGGNDWLSTPRDVSEILHEMTGDSKVNDVTDVYLNDYNHLDFVWGLDAALRVYPDIVDFFNHH
nr:lipase M [Hymenolepis microstoma]